MNSPQNGMHYQKLGCGNGSRLLEFTGLTMPVPCYPEAAGLSE